MEIAARHPELSSAVAAERQRVSSRVRGTELWAAISIVLLGVCSIAYFFATVRISATTRLWMDEVLVVWTARMHPARKIVSALLNGSMLSPPTYHFLIHELINFGGGKVLLRLPSILAVYVVGLVAFFLMRRRFSVPISALAMVLCLETGLLAYAVQVREYALVTACFALALLVWDIPADEEPAIWRVALMTLLLVLAVALHFYAVLFVPVIGLMESVWSLAHRQIRWSYWVGIFLAGASIFAWFPLIARMKKMDAAEVNAARYYARPTLKRLLFAFQQVALGGKAMSLLIVLAIVIALVVLWRRMKPDLPGPPDSGETATVAARHENRGVNLEIIIFSGVVTPIVVFLFAALITHTFNERYAIAGCLGFSLLFAYLLSYARMSSMVSCVLLLSSVALLIMAPGSALSIDKYGDYGLSHLENTAPGVPVVVGEGLVFFEVSEEASPELKRRLVYLTSPPGVVSPDPTNELIIQRWHAIRPDLKIMDPRAFLGHYSRFYVLHTSKSTDVITPWLIQRGMLQDVTWQRDNIWLFEVNRSPRSLALNSSHQ